MLILGNSLFLVALLLGPRVDLHIVAWPHLAHPVLCLAILVDIGQFFRRHVAPARLPRFGHFAPDHSRLLLLGIDPLHRSKSLPLGLGLFLWQRFLAWTGKRARLCLVGQCHHDGVVNHLKSVITSFLSKTTDQFAQVVYDQRAD